MSPVRLKEELKCFGFVDSLLRDRITWLCGKGNVVLRSMICEIRERIAKQFLYLMVILHILALVSIQLCIACSWPLWISEATGWTILLSSILLQSSLLFPRFLQRQITLDLWFLIVTSLAASHLSPWHAATEEVLHTSLQFILVLFWRMPALVMCNRISFLFLGNVIFLCLVPLRERESTDSSLSISLWIELMIFVTTFAFGLAMQSVLTLWAQMNITGDDAKEQCSTIHTLLRFMCDAVFTMDDEGCLVHHSPNLAALLYVDENLEGSKLMDFMTEFEADSWDHVAGKVWKRTGKVIQLIMLLLLTERYPLHPSWILLFWQNFIWKVFEDVGYG